MTEHEKLRQAKQWIDSLAEGLHPVTGESLSPEDVVNDVRVSRCLFFVSEILRRQLAESKAEPLGRAAVPVSAKPISASELARLLQSAAGCPGSRTLRYADIVQWLLRAGLLREVTGPDGRVHKRPTPAGEWWGISVEERVGKSGVPYRVVVYNEKAQRLVADHLEAIAENQ